MILILLPATGDLYFYKESKRLKLCATIIYYFGFVNEIAAF